MKNGEERLAYRVDETAKKLGICKSTVFNRINDGTLKSFKLGNATLIPASEIDRLLSSAS